MYIPHATIRSVMDGDIFEKITGFEWDSGNKGKNFRRHDVTDEECEEVFFDHNKRISKDTLYSDKEKRYIIVGQTKKSRLLFIVFTIRKVKVRIISSRDLNKKEHKLYESR